MAISIDTGKLSDKIQHLCMTKILKPEIERNLFYLIRGI